MVLWAEQRVNPSQKPYHREIISLHHLEVPNQMVSEINIFNDSGVQYEPPLIRLSFLIKSIGWAEINTNERYLIETS